MLGPEVAIYTHNHRHDETDIPMIQQGYTEMKPVYMMMTCGLGEGC